MMKILFKNNNGRASDPIESSANIHTIIVKVIAMAFAVRKWNKHYFDKAHVWSIMVITNIIPILFCCCWAAFGSLPFAVPLCYGNWNFRRFLRNRTSECSFRGGALFSLLHSFFFILFTLCLVGWGRTIVAAVRYYFIFHKIWTATANGIPVAIFVHNTGLASRRDEKQKCNFIFQFGLF